MLSFKATTAALVGVLILAVTACDQGPKLSAEQYMQRASDRRLAGDLRGAVIELKNAVQVANTEPRARLMLGEIYIDLAQGVAAEVELNKARDFGAPPGALIKPLGQSWLLQGKNAEVLEKINVQPGVRGPQRALVLVLRGSAQRALGQLDDAQRLFEEALSEFPESTEALVGLASVAVDRFRFDEADARVASALALAPKDPDALAMRGDIAFFRGDFKASRAAFVSVVEQRPDNLAPRLGLTRAMLALDEVQPALKMLTAMQKITPNHGVTNFLLALAYYQSKDYQKARTQVDIVLKSEKDNHWALLLRGAASYALGDKEQALRSLSQSVAINPNNTAAREMLGATQLLMNRPKDAVATLEPATRGQTKDARLLNLIGEAALRSGDSTRAQTYYQRAVAAKPDDTTARLNLGATKVALGQREEGIRIIQETVQEHPDLKGAEYDLATKLLRQGATAEALQIATRLTTNEPKAAEPFILLALVRRAEGNLDAAQAALETALGNNPNHVGAAHALADVFVRKGAADQAEAVLGRVLAHQAGHLRTLMALAAIQQGRGQQDAAMKTLSLAADANPDAVEPRLLLAQDLLVRGDVTRAQALLRPLQSQNANHPGLLQLLGQTFMASRQPAAAAVEFQKLVAAHPTEATAHYLLAQAYGAASDRTKAAAALDRALALDPNLFPARIAKVRSDSLAGKKGEVDIGLAALRKSLPDDPNVDALEAWIKVRRDRPGEAIGLYRKALAKAPSQDWAQELASAQWAAGEKDDSLKTLDAWVAQHPQDIETAMILANNYLSVGKRAEAAEVYQKVVAQQPTLWLALNNLADLTRKDNPKAALEYAEKAFKVAPNVPPVMQTLGQILTDVGQHQRAVGLLRRVVDGAPNAPALRFDLARALAGAGQKDEARAILKQILGKDEAFAQRSAADRLLKELGG